MEPDAGQWLPRSVPQTELSVSCGVAVPVCQWSHPSVEPWTLHNEVRE